MAVSAPRSIFPRANPRAVPGPTAPVTQAPLPASKPVPKALKNEAEENALLKRYFGGTAIGVVSIGALGAAVFGLGALPHAAFAGFLVGAFIVTDTGHAVARWAAKLVGLQK